MTQAQRNFLETIVDEELPCIYVHAGLTHSVYVTRMAQLHPYKFAGRDEPTYQVTMVATRSEATGYSAAEQFLFDCANDVIPLVYVDRNEERHYVAMTRLTQSFPFKWEEDERNEPIYQLTLVDARAVADVQGVDGALVAEALTSASLYRTVARFDTARFGFAQFE